MDIQKLRYCKHSESMSLLLYKSLNQIARNTHNYPFSDLYDYICGANLLRYAFDECRRNNGVAGIDNVDFKLFNTDNINYYLQDIENQLKSGTYLTYPYKRIHIKSDGGKERAICIPTVRDRIVQKAVSVILSAIIDPVFLSCSYAYRPYLGTNDAIGNLLKLIERKGKHYAYNYDIQKYFDNINREKLFLYLEKLVGDPKLLNLIRNIVEAESIQDGDIICPDSGIQQGSPVSPILSNLYLHHLDSFWHEKEYNKKFNAELIRYADDILVMAKYENPKVTEAISSCLGELGLTLNLKKSKQINLRLGQKMNFLGYEIKMTKVKPMILDIGPRIRNVKRLKSKIDRLCQASQKNVIPPEEVLRSITSQVEGFKNYYMHSTSGHIFNELDNIVNEFRRRKGL